MPKTLYELDANIKELCFNILNEAFKGGQPTFLKGKGLVPHFSFIDIDQVILNKTTMELLMKLIADGLKKLCLYLKENESELVFNKVAIINKGDVGSPVGLISLFVKMSLILRRPIIIIQDVRRLKIHYVKGELKKGDKVLIIDDVSETGMTLHSAMLKIWKVGASVPVTLTVFDKSKGAAENLSQYGVKLFSLFSMEEVYKRGGKEFERIYKKSIRPDFKKEYIDFGGYSLTKVRRHWA